MPRLTAVLARHPIWVGAAALLATLLLAIPMVLLSPEGFASQEPKGPAFDAREILDTRLSPDIATEFVIIEARDGDILDPEDLRELHRRLSALRDDPVTGPLLVETFDPELGLPLHGTLAPTDLLDRALADLGGVRDAPDAAIEAAVVELLGGLVDPSQLGLAVQAAETDGRWSSPALTLALQLDNQALGGGSGGAQVGGDTADRERQLREVRDVLRGGGPGAGVARDDAGSLIAHVVAGDVNLTSEEQGQAAGPFIAIAVFLTLMLVGLVFRSAWVVAVVGAGIAALMIWLQGGANLLGLQQDQILATIVPIALIAFGIDFAFHAIGRVEEERAAGRPPRGALAAGLAGVGGALLLVLGSDVAAFLANTVSGIESIVQFGLAAALGLVAAFVLLGIVAPTVLAGIGERQAADRRDRPRAVAHLLGALAVAGATTTSVLLTVFVAPLAGVAVFVALVLFGVIVPAGLVARRHRRRASGSAELAAADAPSNGSAHPARLATLVGATVAWVARRGAIVLPAAVLLTGLSVAAALQVETRFDVRDFFAEETDFVQSLDALDDYVGDTGGEPTRIVVTADLSHPEVVSRLATEVDVLREIDGQVFASDADGRTLVDGGVIDLLRFAVATPDVRTQVETATGVALTDSDAGGVPDTADGIDAVLRVAADQGLIVNGGQAAWSPAEVSGLIDRGTDDDATRLTLQLPGSREVTAIAAAQELLQPRIDALRADLRTVDPGASVELTGAPITRQLTLDAISRALLLSLPIALLACLAVAGVAMRSVRYALIAVVPIVMVVPWLYGTMAIAGFAVNLVTGTIGAISIGIGIDFAIHLIARYREELSRREDREAAMLATGAGTGVALLASAGSSAIGFSALAFAPMPLFATYGLLTAIMIAMALVATLLVLPPLLRLATPHAPPVARDQCRGLTSPSAGSAGGSDLAGMPRAYPRQAVRPTATE